MPRAMSLRAREAFATCRTLERPQVAVFPAVRTALVMLAVACIAAATHHLSEASSLILGILLVSMADLKETYRVRIGTMLWATLWCASACALGGLVSEVAPLHIVVAFVFAAITGFAAALGGRGALVGVLCLVVFAVYSGHGIGWNSTANDAALFAAGGLLATGVAAAIWPLHRQGDLRACSAAVYRQLSQATRRSGAQLANPAVAAEIMATQTALDHSRAGGLTRAWFEQLLRYAEESRLGLIALMADRQRDPQTRGPGNVEAIVTAGGGLAEAIAQTVSRARQSRDLAGAVRRMRDALGAIEDDETRVLAHAFADPLLDTADFIQQQPWPIGRRAEGGHTPLGRPSWRSRLQAHAHIHDAFAEHAFRLSLAFGIATIASASLPLEHSYWLPMTVAWIAKPDLGATVSRVVMRVLGTLLGVIAVGLALGLTPLDASETVIIAAIAVGGYLVIAYLWANYVIAVVGITTVIMSLQAAEGQPVVRTIAARLLATIAAGIWVLFVSLIRPHRAGRDAVRALTATVASLRGYAHAIATGADLPEHRASVLRERAIAVAAVAAAESEPPGIFERDPVHVDAEAAAELLGDVIDATAALVAEDVLHQHGQHDEKFWLSADSSLTSLETRLAELSPSA